MRIANLDLFGSSFGNLNNFVMSRRWHKHPRRGITRLPGVLKTTLHAFGDSFVEIGVIQNDVGRFAAKFLRHTFNGIGGRFRDHDTGARRTGKRHHIDIRMLRHCLSDGWPVTVNQIENARRNTGIVQNFCEKSRVQRSHFDGLSTIVHPAASAGATYRRFG